MANPITLALDGVISNLRTTRRRFQQAQVQRREGRRLADSALRKLRTIPGPPVYPLRWKSDRQRRAFFATQGFGRGIPARRGSPPRVTLGWEAEAIPTREGMIVALTNSEPHWKFVQGDDAQPFHQDTGWVQIGDVAEDFFREAEDAAVSLFFEAADPLEGV